MFRPIARFLRDESGPTAVEYAVMLAMILMAVLGVIGVVGNQAGGMWGNIDTELNAHGFGQVPN
jgi:pilus assembly protein Flp/PilA